MAASPDGELLAGNGGDRTIKLWNVASGQIERELAGHAAKIVSLEFSPDGKWLVSTGGGEKSRGELFVWDVQKGEQRCGVEHLQGMHNTIYSACFSGDGGLLAWTAGGHQIEICDARTCARTNVIRSRSLEAHHLAFSRCGRWLASLDSKKQLSFWGVPQP
jgi:WD40 repeat protein